MHLLELKSRASTLLQHYTLKLDQKQSIGGMSVSIYDTAWVSMIIKNTGDTCEWLFPKSFDLVVTAQQLNGGWEIDGSEIDGLLSKMAALLSILKHHHEEKDSLKVSTEHDLQSSISKAVSWLKEKLQIWDFASAVGVGFEILVPMHLYLLSQHGLDFSFPEKQLLLKTYEEKMSKFDAALIYSGKNTTFAHSLEALIGKIDFDRASVQLSDGSMMASPSATAAYLMEGSWDEVAESYLKDVFQHGAGKGTGGFPSAFPSEVFEISWVCNFLERSLIILSDLSSSSCGRYWKPGLPKLNSGRKYVASWPITSRYVFRRLV
jgi:hypothetical protein